MLQRTVVGAPTLYRDRLITVRLMGPDFLCYVDDVKLSSFYVSASAAINAAQSYINDEIKQQERK